MARQDAGSVSEVLGQLGFQDAELSPVCHYQRRPAYLQYGARTQMQGNNRLSLWQQETAGLDAGRGHAPGETGEPASHITAESEYAGGCPTGTCPF